MSSYMVVVPLRSIMFINYTSGMCQFFLLWVPKKNSNAPQLQDTEKQAYFDHIPILFDISKTIYGRVESSTSF